MKLQSNFHVDYCTSTNAAVAANCCINFVQSSKLHVVHIMDWSSLCVRVLNV